MFHSIPFTIILCTRKETSTVYHLQLEIQSSTKLTHTKDDQLIFGLRFQPWLELLSTSQVNRKNDQFHPNSKNYTV